MKKFLIRICNVAVILAAIFGYDYVVEAREAADAEAKAEADAINAQIAAEYGEEETEEESGFTDGVYRGTSAGFGGDITVEVTIEGGMIADIVIVSAENEDGAYLSAAEGIIDDILEAQSVDVDTVSGATYSSTGIRNAAALALQQAE